MEQLSQVLYGGRLELPQVNMPRTSRIESLRSKINNFTGEDRADILATLDEVDRLRELFNNLKQFLIDEEHNTFIWRTTGEETKKSKDKYYI